MKKTVFIFLGLIAWIPSMSYAQVANTPTSSEVMCTMDAMLCPDGITSVGRVAPTCAFAPCPPTAPSTTCVDLKNNFRLGATDFVTAGEVSALQGFLYPRYLAVQPTGRFLGMTQSAVIAFQRDQGISPVSGIVGPLTRAKIRDLTCGSSGSTSAPVSNPTPAPAPAPLPTPVTTIPGEALTIASLDPASARVGQTVIIRGNNFFRPETKLLFDGMSIPGRPVYERASGAFNSAFQFTVPSSIVIECVRVKPTDPCPLAPARLVTPGVYQITVENNLGRASVNFTVLGANDIAPKIEITALSPSSGSIGTEVVIRGTGLNAGNDEIYFGGSLVSRISGTINEEFGTLRFRVPADITACGVGGQNLCRIASRPVTPGTYEVAVVNRNGTSNRVNFTVVTADTTQQPTITSFAPSSLRAGEVLTINGTNFPNTQVLGFLFLTNTATGAQLPFIGATHFDNSPTQTRFAIPTTVPVGTYRASVRFGGGIQSAQSSQTIQIVSAPSTNAPQITSISPTTASPGAEITINGQRLNSGDPRIVLNDGIFVTPIAGRASDNVLVFILPSVSAVPHTVRVVNSFGTSNAVTLNVVNQQTIPAPTISSLSPTSGAVGTRVVITGTNMNTGEEVVTFGGSLRYVNIIQPRVPGRIEFIVPSQIAGGCSLFTTNTVCPAGALLDVTPGTYEVSVVNRNGTSNRVNFTVTAPNTVPTPVISSFSPTSVQAGQTITVNGTNFPNVSMILSSAILTNTTTGAVISFPAGNHGGSTSQTQITIQSTVPAGSYRLAIRFAGGTQSAQATQTLQVVAPPVANPPQINSISPTSVQIGSQITLSGVRLGTGGDTRVLLSIGNDTGFIIPDSTRAQDGFLTFSLPASMSRYCLPGVMCPDDMISVVAGTYNVRVVNASGTSNAVTLTVTEVKPSISALSPAQGTVGTRVTVTGQNISSQSDFVWFGSVRVTPDRTVTTPNTIVFQVPNSLFSCTPTATSECLTASSLPVNTTYTTYDVMVEKPTGTRSNLLTFRVLAQDLK